MSNIPLFTGIGDPKATGYSFDLGSIRDPKYGTAENLTGMFKYVSYPGVYKRSPYLDNPKQLDKIVLDLLPNGRELFPDDLDEDVLKKMRDFTLATVLAFPSEQMEESTLKELTLSLATAFSMDDLFEMLLQDDNPDSYKQGKSIVQKGYAKLTTRYSDSEVDMFAFVEEILPSGHLKIDVVRKAVLQLKELTKGLTREEFDKLLLGDSAFTNICLESFFANILYAEFRRTGKYYKSIEAMYNMFRRMSGGRQMMELAFMVFHNSLNSSVRKDILFEAAMTNVDDMIVCSNAILGLARDIAKDNEDGPLMYLVTYKQWPLQKAFDEVYGRYQDAYEDFLLNRAKLAEVYSDDTDVLKYIEAIGYYLDGILNCYKIMERYGCKKNIKIMYSNEA